MRCAVEFISKAANAGADIILLPEALDCGWCHDSARASAGAIPGGESCLRLREAALTHRIHVCAGLIERADDSLFNSAVLISPEGEVLLPSSQAQRTRDGVHLYAQGDRLAVAHTPLGSMAS